MSTPEGKVKDMVKRALARLVYPGTTRSAVFSFMPVQCGFGGVGLDFFECINGKFIAIETKAKGKKPTPRQKTTIADIFMATGLAFVVDGEESLAFAISTICDQCHVEYGPKHD